MGLTTLKLSKLGSRSPLAATNRFVGAQLAAQWSEWQPAVVSAASVSLRGPDGGALVRNRPVGDAWR